MLLLEDGTMWKICFWLHHLQHDMHGNRHPDKFKFEHSARCKIFAMLRLPQQNSGWSRSVSDQRPGRTTKHVANSGVNSDGNLRFSCSAFLFNTEFEYTLFINNLSLFYVSTQTLVPVNKDTDPVDVISLTKGWLSRVCELLGAEPGKIREGELAAFLSYAMAYPQNFLPVIDSYSVGW